MPPLGGFGRNHRPHGRPGSRYLDSANDHHEQLVRADQRDRQPRGHTHQAVPDAMGDVGRERRRDAGPSSHCASAGTGTFRRAVAKDSAGHEQRGQRYAVAIQSDAILLSTLIVAPTSTSAQPAIFRPEIEMDGTRTLVLVDQMRAVDASRLGDFAARLDAAETGEVDRAIKLLLGTL